MSYNKVLVFNLGFEKKSDYKEHWIYIPDKKINFYRIGFYDNILNSDRLSMYIEIGFQKEEKIDVQKELKQTLDNLEKMGITKGNKLISHSTVIMDPAYVHIDNDINKKLEKYKQSLADKQIYTIGRYGGWTYCSMEDCMIEAKALVEKINK